MRSRIFLIPEWIFAVIRTWFFHRENNGTTEVLHFSKVFKLSIFLVFIYRLKTDSKNFQNADVGPRRPANLRPFERRLPVAAAPAAQDEATETLNELEHDLEHLTADIPKTTIDDIPIRLQHYVVGSQDLIGGSCVGWPVQWCHIEIITNDWMVVL